jgi:hypothetical protein
MKQTDFRDKFKEVSKSVCTSTVVYHTPSTSSTVNTPEDTQEDSFMYLGQ